MTPTPIDAINEFLKSPLGIYVGIILAALATYLAALLKQKGDTKSRQRLQSDRDDESNKNIAAIRSIAVDALNRTIQLEQDKDTLEAAARAATASAEAARVSEKAAKDAEISAKNRSDGLQVDLSRTNGDLTKAQQELKTAQQNLTTREEESRKNAEDIQALRKQFEQVEGERDAALKLVETRDGEIKQRDSELKDRDDKIAMLEKRQGDNEKEIERLNQRVEELEKRKTGQLPELPSDLAPSTPVE